MERWKVIALVSAGFASGMSFMAACGVPSSHASGGGGRAVIYLDGLGNTGGECPLGFTDVGRRVPAYSGQPYERVCLED